MIGKLVFKTLLKMCSNFEKMEQRVFVNKSVQYSESEKNIHPLG